MAPSKRTAIAVAAGAVAVAAGLGVAGIASADPTPTPGSTPTSGQTSGPDGRGWGHHRGPRMADLAGKLAEKLGVEESKVADALRGFRQQNRPMPQDPADRPDPAERDAALAKYLAGELKIDEAKVTAALADLRTERNAERAAALKSRLDQAVKDGTLTQAEADAVTKAVEKGVIGGGPR